MYDVLYVCMLMCGCRGEAWGLVACFFQAEDGIRDLVRSRGLGDVYKRQAKERFTALQSGEIDILSRNTTWTMSRDTSLGLKLSLIHI